MNASPNITRRSVSPSQRRIHEFRKKQNSLESNSSVTNNITITTHLDNIHLSHPESKLETGNNDGSGKSDNISDNGSEISDEGYRSLGLIQNNNGVCKRASLLSEVSNDEAECNGEFFIL